MTIFLLSPDISEQQHSNEKKRVTFSDQARMSYYDEPPSYHSNIAYTFDEIKNFQANTTLEVFRLRQLVNTGIPIRGLIEMGILSCEEILGVEQIINEMTAQAMICQRRNHTDIVVKFQEENEMAHSSDVETLARVAIASSSKCIERAQLRAYLAA